MKRSKTTSDVRGRRVAKHIERLQARWAGWMSAVAGRLSFRTQKIVFVAFVLLGAAYCIFLITGKGVMLPATGSIMQPKLPEYNSNTGLPEEEAKWVRGFRDYLDSLSQTQKGKELRDSLLSNNPGLIDSLVQWEKRLNQLN